MTNKFFDTAQDIYISRDISDMFFGRDNADTFYSNADSNYKGAFLMGFDRDQVKEKEEIADKELAQKEVEKETKKSVKPDVKTEGTDIEDIESGDDADKDAQDIVNLDEEESGEAEDSESDDEPVSDDETESSGGSGFEDLWEEK